MSESDPKTPAIIVDNVTKTYRSYNKPLDRLRELTTGRQYGVDRDSICDVGFQVGQGEVVGIIGQNGAGKSTLLKMIAGRLEPTRGKVSMNGSVSAILELGSGFHPDLSGRENVRVGGLCMGLTKRQIDDELDNIIAFSELEDVIDMPFRTYSSGMQARLTFATAITVDPDILIIDEALSVGDNRFQMKSFSRIMRFKEVGKTILLVTHSMSTVTTFCDRAILIDKGRILADGDPNRTTSIYHHLQFGEIDQAQLLADQAEADKAADAVSESDENDEPPNDAPEEPSPKADEIAEQVDLPAEDLDDSSETLNPAEPVPKSGEDDERSALVAEALVAYPEMTGDPADRKKAMKQGYRYGDERAVISGVTILDAQGQGPVRQLSSGKSYYLLMDCEARTDIERLYCGFLVRNQKGEILFGSDTTIGAVDEPAILDNLIEGERRRIVMAMTMWLTAGTYFITGAATAEQGRQSDMWFDAFEFTVVDTLDQHTNSCVNLQPSFQVSVLGK